MDEDCVFISDVIAPKYRSIFPYQKFNHMQSLVFDQLLNTDANTVIAAPTGSGKTVCHELAIVRCLNQCDRSPGKEFKCVFIAPNKALCQQRALQWTKLFSPLGLRIIEVTGDSEGYQSLNLITKANIVITTPEKWDALTRSWRKHIFLFGRIDLLLIDEVHHIHEDRGAILETVCVRMRTLCEAYKIRVPQKSGLTDLRILALSATLPNISDIGEWLQCSPGNIHYFDESFRPVPLEVHVLGYSSMSNLFLFEKSLDEKVLDVIYKYADKKQVLIFCPTKKNSETLCHLLATNMGYQGKSSVFNRFHDDKLQNLVGKGYAYHHAGVPPDDRAQVESLFIAGNVKILCATSTLAHGVNLPAHLVIIKGTNQWRGGSKGYEKLPRSMVTQMMGRAGRPGYDLKGVAVVMTSREDKLFFESAASQLEIVESNLLLILTEALCAEITQTVVEDIADAIHWLKSTFFYIRARKNPGRYGFSDVTSIDDLEEKMKDLCLARMKDLSSAGIVLFDEIGYGISPLPEAFIMTKHIIRFKTMLMIMQIPANSDIEKVLQELSQADETQKTVKRNEKVALYSILKSSRFPGKMKVKDPCQKTNALLQAAIQRNEIKDFSMRVEQSEVVEQSLRVLSAIQEYAIEKEKGKLLESCIYINRSLHQRMWETGYEGIFSQAPGVNENLRIALANKNLKTLDSLHDMSQLQLQKLVGCSAAEAQRVLNFGRLCSLNQLDMIFDFTSKIGILSIQLKSSEANQEQVAPSVSSNISFQLVCYNSSNGKLLCYRKIQSGRVASHYTVNMPDDLSPLDVHGSLIAEHIGLDCIKRSANEIQTSTKSTKKKQPIVQASIVEMIPEMAFTEPSSINKASPEVFTPHKIPLANDSERSQVKSSSTHRVPLRVGQAESIRAATGIKSYSEQNVGVNRFSKYANRLEDFEDIEKDLARFNTKTIMRSKDTGFKQPTTLTKRFGPSNTLEMLRTKSDELGLDNISLKRLRSSRLEEPKEAQAINSILPDFSNFDSHAESMDINSISNLEKCLADTLAEKQAYELRLLLNKHKEEAAAMRNVTNMSPGQSQEPVEEIRSQVGSSKGILGSQIEMPQEVAGQFQRKFFKDHHHFSNRNEPPVKANSKNMINKQNTVECRQINSNANNDQYCSPGLVGEVQNTITVPAVNLSSELARSTNRFTKDSLKMISRNELFDSGFF